MGNNGSSPQSSRDKYNFENPDQLKDDILKQISVEMQNTQKNLERTKYTIEKSAYNAHKKQIEELKMKFIEFYKFTQINDGMIKRLSTTNAELEKTLSEYKKELLKYENQSEDLKENLNKKEQDLLSRYSRVQQDLSKEIDTRKKSEEDIKEYRDKCETYERHIKNLESSIAAAKRELFIETQLRQKAEIGMKIKQRQQDFYNKQAGNLKDLQEKLTQAQDNLEKEKAINQQGSFKLQAVTQYCENLNSQKEQKEAQLQGDTDRLKSEVNQLENQLSRTKFNLGKSRRDVRQLEEFKKKAEIELEEKQKQIDDYLNQLEVLKTYYKQALGSAYKEEDEKEVDKLYFDFISKCQNNLNDKIRFSGEKKEDTCHNDKEEIQKYEQIIEELKNELKSSDMRFQEEQKVRKEIQGKLFLVERNFESLKIFCSKELQDLKFYLKNKKPEGKSASSLEQENSDLITFDTETIQKDGLSSEVKIQGKEDFSEKKFCVNQQKEMNELHKEFENVFS